MKQKMHKVVIGSCMAAALVFFSAAGLSGAGGEVRHVPRDYATIQSAVDTADEGDTILVAPGVYTENVVISKSGVRLRGGKNVVLDGAALGGIGRGIQVLGTAAAPLLGIEITNFEIRNYDRGISLVWAVEARVTHNYVHDNADRFAPLAVGDTFGIGLSSVSASDVSHNLVSRNGLAGIAIDPNSTGNTVHHNRIVENGTQTPPASGPALDGSGIFLNGNSNQIQYNEILANNGRGVMVFRPGSVPLTGVLVAHNRVHDNQRAGVAIMLNATGNIVIHNDARGNNLSGLAPCFRCNLFDNSAGRNGGNLWALNHGTYSGTDACAP